MKRILVYGMTDNKGGIEAYLVNYLKKLAVGNKVTFDFVTDYKDIAYKDLLGELNCNIYYIPSRRENLLSHMKALRKIIKDHTEYTCAYFNILSASEAFTILSLAGISRIKIVVHSHNSSVKSIVRHRLLRPFLNLMADDRLACSSEAGVFMFGNKYMRKNKVKIVHNAIETSQYIASDEIRQMIRTEFGLEDRLVVGHVGRLCYQKNTLFLLEIYKRVLEIHPESFLLLVGEGEDRELVERKIKEEGIADHVILTGMRSDVAHLLQAMDVFVLPSRFEGLPVVGIEAQAAGLHCVFADTFTKESDITGNVTFLSLQTPINEWAETVIRLSKKQRDNMEIVIKKMGYDIQLEAYKLEEYFLRQ